MSSLGRQIELVEQSISVFKDKFLESPFSFYTESDMHCYLYKELSFGFRDEHNVKIGNKDKTVQTTLLHNEYPTLSCYYKSKAGVLIRYNKEKNKKPNFRPTRGRFDLAIIDPDSPGNFKKKRTSIAIELSLNKDIDKDNKLIHLTNDYTKLTDEKNDVDQGYIQNDVDQGYILHFIRTEELSKTLQNRLPELRKNIDEFKQNLDQKVKFLYLETNKPNKKPKFISSKNWAPMARLD